MEDGRKFTTKKQKTMETIYYTREANAMLNTLIEAGDEVELKMLLEKAKVNFLIAPTVLSGLLQGQEIVYRMEDGVQYFRVNENYHLLKRETDNYRPRDVDIYLRFRQAIKQYFREHYSVSDYAAILRVTPKYLATVVRRVSGQTAKKLIEQETVDEIKHTLLHTQLTAKEISAQFHFPNTSSFCRFFTRHTGVTPQEFQKNSLIIK